MINVREFSIVILIGVMDVVSFGSGDNLFVFSVPNVVQHKELR